MHVDDLGEAVIFALENWNPSNDLAPINKDGNPLTFLNVGTGIDLSIKELSEKIAQITNFNGEIIWDKNKPDGTPKKQLDITKMKSLGWESKIDLDKGIRSTVEIFKSNLLKNR